jgi:21S rRNA (uridine2791-2'-O)-methyltransferase
VQAEVKRFISDPDRGRPKQQLFSNHEQEGGATVAGENRSYIDLERHADEDTQQGVMNKKTRKRKEDAENIHHLVDVVLSDMSAPWMQTTGFWKRSLSNPYIRMMNTSGINFKDHTGSMVSFITASNLHFVADILLGPVCGSIAICT